jgi:hypothetical protein
MVYYGFVPETAAGRIAVEFARVWITEADGRSQDEPETGYAR